MENVTKTRRVNITKMNTIVHNFDEKDLKGRRIGAAVFESECDFEAFEPGALTTYSYFTEAPGHVFVAEVQATRNDKPYGASQRTKFFRSERERAFWVEKRLASSRKAASKKAAAA